MKVSRLLCVCLIASSTHLAGCGDSGGASELERAQTNSAPESDGLFESVAGSAAAPTDAGADAAETAAHIECPDPCAEQPRCGQICLTLKGAGSSCQLTPTVNDLTRPPRGVRFGCSQLKLGPNGYDFDELGHITLTGDACSALQEGGPHRISLILSCPP